MKSFDLEVLDSSNSREAASLFNEVTKRGEQYYRVLDKNGFDDLFLKPVKKGDLIRAFYANDRKAFIIGHFDGGIKRFFLTMIEVSPEVRRQGIGTFLVMTLQKAFREIALDIKLSADKRGPEIEISYYNPTMIKWNLPGTASHYHNNAQGVLLGSPAHLFFKNLGFRDYDYQNTYYQLLKDYHWPAEKMAPYEERLKKAGYSVEFFDAEKHKDVEGLVSDLDNDLWNWQIPGEIHREGGPRPWPILNDHGKMRGFAGPIVVEEDGRCWFLGVAVHSACRGAGAATLLFNHMVQSFKDNGAVYMTFFTAEDNFARNIYEGAGFRIKTCWVTMRRPGERE